MDLPDGQPPDGRNPLGNHDVIPWTASRHALTSSASSDCHVCSRFTNSNDCPDNGWNRCVTRTRPAGV